MIKRCLILLLTVLCLGASNVSARVCFLPDSDDCGQGEITNMTVTCESQGGYDTEDDCSKGKKTSQICYPNNDCYYRKCQYDSKADCEKHGLISEDTKSHDDSDNPKYINYQEVDVGCEKKCYKATINDCTYFSTQDYLTWGIPETTTNSEWSAPVWVSAGENNETVCRNELEKDENYREDYEYSESTEISVGSKKCVFCYYK